MLTLVRDSCNSTWMLRILVVEFIESTKVLLVDAREHIHIQSVMFYESLFKALKVVDQSFVRKVLRKLVLIDSRLCWEAMTMSL